MGCNNFGRRLDYDATSAVVDAALDAGVTFFDTADVYGGTRSEEYLGRALGRRRDDVVVAAKFSSRLDERRRGARPEYVHRAVEDSLRRLGTDRIDLYQLHTPDSDVPIGETLGALDELVRAGKVREVGCSNFSADQLREAEEATRGGAARFASVQNEYSLLHHPLEQDVLPECERAGLAFVPYFPLANGLLTGKYRRGQDAPEGSRLDSCRGERLLTDRNLTIVEKLLEFSGSRGYTILKLAFSWQLRRPGVGDRRSHVARAGEEQRRRCRLETDRCGACRGRFYRDRSSLNGCWSTTDATKYLQSTGYSEFSEKSDKPLGSGVLRKERGTY